MVTTLWHGMVVFTEMTTVARYGGFTEVTTLWHGMMFTEVTTLWHCMVVFSDHCGMAWWCSLK